VVAGIVFQLAAIVVFVILGADFILRLIADRPYHRSIVEKPAVVEPEHAGDRKRWMIMLATVFFSALMIVMRGIYRTIELLQGECCRPLSDCVDCVLTPIRLGRIPVGRAFPGVLAILTCFPELPTKSTSTCWIFCR
jgi:hypothetical protein